MQLVTIRVTLRVAPGLRSQRRTVRSVLEKVHRHFNVAVAELEGGSHSPEVVLGFASLAAGRREVRDVLGRVLEALAAHPRLEIVAVDWDDH